MAITTYEGVVKQGQIHLKTKIRLPENTKVYIIVPGVEAKKTTAIYSPRLANQKQISDFQMEVTEEEQNASL
jgi:hypothetical protein